MGQLSYPYGQRLISGRLKSCPEDFRVVEELGFDPGGSGEHLFLWIEKTAISTHELIGQVAKDFSLPEKHIGYSGLKDKQAITRQWLSLHLPGRQATLEMPPVDGYRILEHAWHDKKLRPGTHRHNRFEVCLRDVESLPEASLQQLQCIGEQGMANYFGAQRFGQNQDNVAQALKQLSRRKLGRNKKSLLLSSLRSHLFNQILCERIDAGYWQEPASGDLFMLAGTRSWFSEALSPELLRRYRSLDISSCASLYGSGESRMSGEALAIEARVFVRHQEITRCLDEQRAKSQMRVTRVIPGEFSFRHDAADKTLSLSLRLTAGSYLTTLLDHFIST